MMRLIFIIVAFYSLIKISAQSIQVSDKLEITKLSENTYIHTCENSNGIVFINGNEAIIVSTPDSDIETQNLINWVRNNQKAKIVAYVIDRWHPDAMEGLDIVHKNGIKSYAYELTRKIAKAKGLPIPQIGFDPGTAIQVGNEKVVCHFLGEAHTKDGIVVWIPKEQILFGGNEIRNFNGWVGNIGDAILDQWSETALNVKRQYGSAKFVIPGHGNYGGVELIDYTIDLYKSCKKDSLNSNLNNVLEASFNTQEEFQIHADTDSSIGGKRILKYAKIITQDSTKLVKIESPHIIFHPDKRRIDSDVGELQIYDKTIEGIILRTNISYKKLLVLKEDDEVGLRVIVKEIAY